MLLIFDLFGPLWIFIMNQYKQTFYRSFFSPNGASVHNWLRTHFIKKLLKQLFVI